MAPAADASTSFSRSRRTSLFSKPIRRFERAPHKPPQDKDTTTGSAADALTSQSLPVLPTLPNLDTLDIESDLELDASNPATGADATSKLTSPSVADSQSAPASPLISSRTPHESATNLPIPTIRTQSSNGEQSEATPAPARTRTGSLAERPREWLFGPDDSDQPNEEPPRPTTSAGDRSFGGGLYVPSELKSGAPLEEIPTRKSRDKLMKTSGSFVNFARRSWRVSRSPSPKPGDSQEDLSKAKHSKEKITKTKPHGESPSKEESDKNNDSAATAPPDSAPAKNTKNLERPGFSVKEGEGNKSADSLKTGSSAFTRASSWISSKKKSKPVALGKLDTNIDSDSRASSAVSLAPPAKTSTDTRSPQLSAADSGSFLQDESSLEIATTSRDALWSSFKTLDMEFKVFSAKNIAPKVAQIQSQVLPFLRNTMNHESTKKLSFEELDRRATILGKWWNAILEMLEGQGVQQVPGIDRPSLYEAATSIMMRLEWRLSTTYFMPLADRLSTERVRARSWTNSSGSSLTSSQAAFVEESTEHNIRTLFVSNLIRQMSFVVEKLSLRHAPTPFVNFAGKACAYAFFFAPGVSDILIRLWGLSPELIRRVADAVGLPRKNTGESEDIVALFPPSLVQFGWTSPKGMWDNLKQVPKLPVLVSRIPWTGPWVSRWKGRDTDLFFIFCKYYHILCDQFFPPGLPLIEKARAPAFALVQAQLLLVLDSTIHRQTAIDGMYGPALVDSANGADAAMTLPLPPSNVLKGMSENRLVMLLKDFLSDDTIQNAGARSTFADSFSSMMKAATSRISQFNHSACFTLCDLLEEVLLIYSEFEEPGSKTNFIEWEFWFDVCRRILNSFNTMSEVRLISLVFSLWDAISKDPERKWAVCKDWILSEETFNTYFNHWCPMVRAYYHRLLCWRICRDSGTPDATDGKIFALAITRLNTVWGHYLYLKQAAEQEQRMPPSTAPVLPAPGKRFMIIRQELNQPQPGLFLGFDAITKSINDEIAVAEEAVKADGKKRFSLLGKVLSLGSNSGHGSDDDLQTLRRETAEAKSSKGRKSDDSSSSPIFDEQKYVFKFILAWQNQPAPLRPRFLSRPCLPAPAYSRIDSRPDDLTLDTTDLPPPTRQVSGSPQQGLINGAKNASASTSPTGEPTRTFSLGLDRAASWKSHISPSEGSDGTRSPGAKSSPGPSTPKLEANQKRTDAVIEVVQPVKPTGIHTKNVVYAGRALAEWTQVVFECNNFVERRRDEGVAELKDMEIPMLGVDGFRKNPM